MNKTIKRLFFATLLSWLMAAAVQAATIEGALVDFTDIEAGNRDSSLFNVDATTAVDLSDGSKLIIGLKDFFAADGGAAPSAAVDTLTMTINAAPGYLITSVSYTEAGEGWTTNGVASASGFFVADDIPINFPTQTLNPNTGTETNPAPWMIPTMITPITNKTSIDISITNSLFAYAFSLDNKAQITKTSATLTIGVEPVPLPAAVWLFGSTLIGFVAFGRRRLS